ncbi:MAG: YjbE family putative metal transport protein [Stellaceae bacterium]
MELSCSATPLPRTLPVPILPSAEALPAIASVVLIDIVLAGDNAVAVATAAAGLPPAIRRRAIAVGTILATGMRIALALVATELLAIVGLTLAGGLLLLYVAWKLYRDLRAPHTTAKGAAPAARSFGVALFNILAADVSMSLDNVLAIAGTARSDRVVLAIGLLVSVALMAVASNFLAKAMERYRSIGWVGVAIVTLVALRLIYDGSRDILGTLGG